VLDEHTTKVNNRTQLPGSFTLTKKIQIKAKPRTHLGLASFVLMGKARGSTEPLLNRGQHVPYHSRDCNRRGDHSWARTEPASPYRIQHKSLCTFVAGHAHDRLNHHLPCGERLGIQDSDRADSSGPFAGRTLVLRL
jgi:hypothetical protein